MTQEQKDLLLKDLYARLPYGVKISNDIQTKVLDIYDIDWDIDWFINNTEIKPYLFPLSSMTEEQERQYSFFSTNIFSCFEVDLCEAVAEFHDWLNKNHFDYRGLIEKGLAIDCTNLNIY